jgi:glycine/D-amino acid oxidase-like deaminating enzyme
LEIRVKKVVAFHIHKKPPENARAIFYPDYDAFLLPVKESGNWVFSYTCDHWDVKPDANVLHVDADNRDKALAVLEKMAPNFVPYCAGGHAFCDTYSKDYIPVVAKGLQGDNLVIITGANGAGFRLAPALANNAIALFGDAL